MNEAIRPNPEVPPPVIAAPQLSVIIPTFNERDNVVTLFRRLETALAGLSWEAIFVDDNSPDRTWDVVRGLAAGVEVLDRPVRDIMTASVQTAKPEQSVHELAKVMTMRRIRHVPVVVDGAVVGIVSIGDVVKSRIGELEFERDQLEHYVSGPG